MKPLAESPTDSMKEIAPGDRAWLRSLLIALIVLPGVLLAILVNRYGVNVPYWDEWDNSVLLHMKYLDGTLTLDDFFIYTNEHRPALPRVISLATEIATHGNRRAEMFVQILCAAFMVFCVNRLARKTVPDHALALTVPASWLIFSTVQYENWLWGEQLVLVLPVTLLWLGLWIIYSKRSYWFRTVAGIATGLAAICCFAGGFGIYLLLAAVHLIHGRAKRQHVLFAALAWIVAFAIAAKLYTVSDPYNTTPPMPQLLWLAPFVSLLYITIFFGSPFWSHEPPLFGLIIAGAVLLILALFSLVRIWRVFDRALPWLAALGFGTIMAALTLAGRLQFGIQQAMTSRYATFALLFPIATLFLWAVAFGRWSRGARRTVLVIGALLFAAHLYASLFTIKDMRNTYLKRAAGLAELPYINVHDDEKSKILGELYPDRERLRMIANDYAAHGMLPPMVKP
jgi:hypothetical protein